MPVILLSSIVDSAATCMEGPPPAYVAVPGYGDFDLPAYALESTVGSSSSRPRTQHMYSLTNSRNEPWATMKLSSYAFSPEQIPNFVEGDEIVGSLDLSLPKGSAIQSIQVSLSGEAEEVVSLDMSGLPSTNGKEKFLELKKVVWSKSKGDSLSRTSGMPLMFKTPISFSEKTFGFHIHYDLVATFHRGAIRPQSQLRTLINYVPLIRPSPFSLLRQLSYQENTPLLGPEFDPEGWKTIKPIRVVGEMFRQHSSEVLCTLSLAKPLCYKRGGIIPCHMVIRSEDVQALDMLSSPRAIRVCLQRRIGIDGKSSMQSSAGSGKYTSSHIQTAVWWHAPHGNVAPGMRVLQGEIHLPAHLPSTSAIGRFMISYSVVFLPLRAPAFIGQEQGTLHDEIIEIGTVHARGPRPKSYAPLFSSSPTIQS